jgi:crossover junction endodeoxyribonuclease RuvC
VIVLGLDPGLSGALAILNEDGTLDSVHDLPVVRDGKLAWIDGGRLQSMLIDGQRGRTAKAFVERVHAMPKQGVSSSFNFGVGFGSVLSILQARHVSIELVQPMLWKRATGLTSDKNASLDKARILFPTAELSLKKHDGRAEAILLARWGWLRDNAAKVAA